MSWEYAFNVKTKLCSLKPAGSDALLVHDQFLAYSTYCTILCYQQEMARTTTVRREKRLRTVKRVSYEG